MSSLFGQVWFWSLLAFLVGALVTWLLLVRPLQKRVQQLERAPQAPAAAPAGEEDWEKADAEIKSWSAPEEDTSTIPAVGASSGTREGDWLEPSGTAESDRDRTDWLEADSLSGDRASQPADESADEFFRAEDEAELANGYSEEAGGEPAQDSGAGTGTALGAGAVLGAGAAGLTAASGSSDSDQENSEATDTNNTGHTDFGADPEDSFAAQADSADPASAGAEAETGVMPANTGPEATDALDADAAEGESLSALDAEPDRADADQTETSPAGGELPQRRKRGAGRILGGFGTPKPIKPSIRRTVRRNQADAGENAPLFEPVAKSDNGTAVVDEPHVDSASTAGVSAGPFGAGSAMPLPGGEAPSDAFRVKGSVTALRYCTEDSSQYDRMVAEVWFASVADAERVGFRAL